MRDAVLAQESVETRMKIQMMTKLTLHPPDRYKLSTVKINQYIK